VVPEKSAAVKEAFLWHSGGRDSVADLYVKLVQTARELGMSVCGLELPVYLSFRNARPYGMQWAFRRYGYFDAVAGAIIRRNAPQAGNYIVRLGEAHAQLLPPFVDGLQHEEPPAKALTEPSKEEPAALAAAAAKMRAILTPRPVAAPPVETRRITIGAVSYNVARDDSPEMLAQMWQDKVGLPPSAAQQADLQRRHAAVFADAPPAPAAAAAAAAVAKH
jgi:hypothetical protein